MYSQTFIIGEISEKICYSDCTHIDTGGSFRLRKYSRHAHLLNKHVKIKQKQPIIHFVYL